MRNQLNPTLASQNLSKCRVQRGETGFHSELWQPGRLMFTSTTPRHVTPSFISSRLKVAEYLHPLCTTDCVCLHIELVSEDSLSQVMLTHSLLKLG